MSVALRVSHVFLREPLDTPPGADQHCRSSFTVGRDCADAKPVAEPAGMLIEFTGERIAWVPWQGVAALWFEAPGEGGGN